MRLVYLNAQRVIVWLGPSNFHIDNLFDWMIDLDKQVLAIAQPHIIGAWENQWREVVRKQGVLSPSVEIGEALNRLLRREWFSRVWVLQEAAFARSVIITCGQKEVNSRAFVVMPSILNIDCREGEQSRLDILPGILRARSWWAVDSSRDLFTLLQKFGRSKASDPRDIIYALLGLSEDAHSSKIMRPNYDMKLEETIQQCVAYFMVKTHHLPSHAPTQILPQWSLSEFLDCLQDLPLQVFQWAADHAQDILLHHLLSCRRDQRDARYIEAWTSYGGPHGPPITIAMKKENSALVRQLLKFPDIDVETKDFDGNTPMSIALGQGNMVVADSILERMQRKVNTAESGGNTPMLVTPAQGLSTFEELLLKNPELHISAGAGGGDKLVTAIKQRASAAMRSILKSRAAEIHVADSNGDGPLKIAARRGDEKIVDIILKRIDPKHITVRGSDGLTPLDSALAGGFPRITKKLLTYQQDAVHMAARANQFDFLRRILDVEPQLVNDDPSQSLTPLGVAAEAGSTSCVSLLLDRGARINERYFTRPGGVYEKSATPLWLAASRGHLSIVDLLVKRGAIIELKGMGQTDTEYLFYTTPLEIAELKGHIDIVKLLLKAGAKVQVGAGGSGTLLAAAIAVGHMEAVRTLVEESFYINKSSRWEADPVNTESEKVGQQTWASPLWIAASLGDTGIVGLLIQHGADIEARDSYYRMTPFQRASQQKRSEVMTVLAEAGADTRPTN